MPGSLKMIITGDIVNSKSIPFEKKSTFYTYFEEAFKNFQLQGLTIYANAAQEEVNIALQTKIDYTIYRGDSFQIRLYDPVKLLQVIFFLRSYLRTSTLSDAVIDCRLGIGFGKIEYEGKSLNDSDGEAFRWAGEMLEQTDTQQARVQIATPDSEFNKTWNCIFALSEPIVDNWTKIQSGVVNLHILGFNQTQIARSYGIAQSNISKHLSASNWNIIAKNVLPLFEEQIKRMEYEYA